MSASPRRGEIYIVDFDPTVGAEIRKTRPGLIVQNDIGNKRSPITIVAAITSQIGGKLHLTDVAISAAESGLAKDSLVLLQQIRAVDKGRLGRRIGKLTTVTMKQVNQALQISLGLVDL